MNLFNHQKKALFRILEHGNTALFSEMGTGKTITALSVFRSLIEKTPELRLLVICPISLIRSAWGEDNDKTYQFPLQNLRHLRKDKVINPDARIFVINYESAKLDFYRETIEKISAMWPVMCVLDESSRIKNPKASITKFCLKVRDLFKHRLVLSGTPAPNSELEYWAQLRFLGDDIVPSSFYAFRNLYFTLSRGSGAKQQELNVRYATADHFRQGFKYRLRSDKRQAFEGILVNNSFRIKKENCLDLPESLDIKRLIEINQEQAKIYKFMKREAITLINDRTVSVTNALSKVMKLRQITSGFLYRQGAGGEQTVEELKTNPKLLELMEVLEEIPAEKQVLVWTQFQHEADFITRALPEARILNGSTKEHDRDPIIKGFQDGEFRVLIAHPASAGHGLTFVNCHYQVFFSLDYSSERYSQAKARIHRHGQTEKCLYIHLLCEGTIDEIIYEALQKKIDVQELLYKL